MYTYIQIELSIHIYIIMCMNIYIYICLPFIPVGLKMANFLGPFGTPCLSHNLLTGTGAQLTQLGSLCFSQTCVSTIFPRWWKCVTVKENPLSRVLQNLWILVQLKQCFHQILRFWGYSTWAQFSAIALPLCSFLSRHHERWIVPALVFFTRRTALYR